MLLFKKSLQKIVYSIVMKKEFFNSYQMTIFVVVFGNFQDCGTMITAQYVKVGVGQYLKNRLKIQDQRHLDIRETKLCRY